MLPRWIIRPSGNSVSRLSPSSAPPATMKTRPATVTVSSTEMFWNRVPRSSFTWSSTVSLPPSPSRATVIEPVPGAPISTRSLAPVPLPRVAVAIRVGPSTDSPSAGVSVSVSTAVPSAPTR